MDKLFASLMTSVISNLGLHVQASADGVYTLEVNGQVDVHIGCPHDNTIYLFSRIGRLTDCETDELTMCKALLGLNALSVNWSPTVWLSADGDVAIWTHAGLSDLTLTNTVELLSRFMDNALELQEFLNAPPDEPTSPEDNSLLNVLNMRG